MTDREMDRQIDEQIRLNILPSCICGGSFSSHKLEKIFFNIKMHLPMKLSIQLLYINSKHGEHSLHT